MLASSQVLGRTYRAPLSFWSRDRACPIAIYGRGCCLFYCACTDSNDAERTKYLDIHTLPTQQQEAIGLLLAAILEQECERDVVVVLQAPAYGAPSSDRPTRTASGVHVSHRGEPRRSTVKLVPTRFSISFTTRRSSRKAKLNAQMIYIQIQIMTTLKAQESIEDNSEDGAIEMAPREAAETIVQSVESPSGDKLKGWMRSGSSRPFSCWRNFWTSRASSTFIVYFSGLISFPYPATTFERPQNYTPKLLALIYGIRLSLLEATIPSLRTSPIGWRQDRTAVCSDASIESENDSCVWAAKRQWASCLACVHMVELFRVRMALLFVFNGAMTHRQYAGMRVKMSGVSPWISCGSVDASLQAVPLPP